MISAYELSLLKQKCIQYEDNVPWLYLDVNGNVTIGIGHLVANERLACGIDFSSNNEKPATNDEITEAFKAIKKCQFGQNYPAS
ncbi:hypothetical protein [Limnobacter litoralis]|uniref:Lysozyme n=1 Tax=Limnobacter litoralis TaxID=481366 RepID=A0ABQ5YQN2_9BURK|nr:hypothetical protein [Limnobacter litoralis]GLR26928.1 hypothetical protein GCM10007875_20180 [Limnobacter litoralis]